MLRWLDNSETGKVGDVAPSGSTSTPTHDQVAAEVRKPNALRIVLADDNADMRDYVRRLLAGKYVVEAVADGMAALAAVRHRPADLLIADVMMPRLDGFGLLHAIRADEELKTLPVILLSARAGEEAKVEGLDAGADDYLVKPFSARELLARVDTQFELARVRREAMQALRTSEARYRALVHSSTNALYRLSADGTQLLEVSSNGSFEPIPEGTSSLAMLQENVHPDDQEWIYQAWLEAVATQTSYEMDHRGRQDDGSWGWMHSRTVPVRNEANEVVEWIGSSTDITARKRAEESLRQAEERLRLAIEAGKIFTWEVDPTTRKVTYSANVKEVMGFSLHDVTSADRNLVHPDDQAFIADHFVRVLKGEIDYNAEHRFVNPENGEVVWVRAQGVLVRDAQGDRARLVGITQNITERREMEDALRQRVEEFQAHFNLTAVGSVQADAESGQLLLVNRAMCDFTGYSEEELLARTIWEITEPQDRAENEARFGELVRGEIATFELEKRFMRKDGTVRWGLVSVTVAQRDEDGKPLRTGSVVLDITKRKGAEEALRQLNETLEGRVQERTEQVRESERRFRALVDASAQIVWTMDAQGRVIEDFPSWRAFTGQSGEESNGWGWMIAVHPSDRELALRKWRRAVANEAPVDTELRIRHVSGEWHWMQVRAVPLRDEKGQVRGWVGMNIDINERKQAEADRARLARSLLMAEQEERRRISQVLHDDLQQLLYATQMRMATVGQDLQVAGQEALMDELEEARQWLKQCIDTTRQMTVELSPPILKNEGLADAIEWLKPQMERLHGLKIVINAEHSFRVADEDLRALLFQIVRELLFNVAKHAGVERAVVELDQEEDHLVIRVIDEGRGFDQKMIGERKPNAGFGLFSVQERLRLVGGRMEVHSQLGVGTQVVVHAPVPMFRLE
jgi:PAS domain S-box-containing protein